jgi:alkanesulfonate monooxygenase SsuD/methylene tetrahydromethanopterin reductase-like flavin-dependent oxidoreductase (luciferase family)
LLIGGNGAQKTLPLVARFADEWNALIIPKDEITRLNARLDDLLKLHGRQPQDVRRSLMTGCVFGKDQDEVARKVAQRTQGQRTAEELRQRGLIVGTAEEIIEQCQQLAGVGIQRLMLQWLDLDDVAGIENMADGILDRLSG